MLWNKRICQNILWNLQMGKNFPNISLKYQLFSFTTKVFFIMHFRPFSFQNVYIYTCPLTAGMWGGGGQTLADASAEKAIFLIAQ